MAANRSTSPNTSMPSELSDMKVAPFEKKGELKITLADLESSRSHFLQARLADFKSPSSPQVIHHCDLSSFQLVRGVTVQRKKVNIPDEEKAIVQFFTDTFPQYDIREDKEDKNVQNEIAQHFYQNQGPLQTLQYTYGVFANPMTPIRGAQRNFRLRLDQDTTLRDISVVDSVVVYRGEFESLPIVSFEPRAREEVQLGVLHGLVRSTSEFVTDSDPKKRGFKFTSFEVSGQFFKDHLMGDAPFELTSFADFYLKYKKNIALTDAGMRLVFPHNFEKISEHAYEYIKRDAEPDPSGRIRLPISTRASAKTDWNWVVKELDRHVKINGVDYAGQVEPANVEQFFAEQFPGRQVARHLSQFPYSMADNIGNSFFEKYFEGICILGSRNKSQNMDIDLFQEGDDIYYQTMITNYPIVCTDDSPQAGKVIGYIKGPIISRSKLGENGFEFVGFGDQCKLFSDILTNKGAEKGNFASYYFNYEDEITVTSEGRKWFTEKKYWLENHKASAESKYGADLDAKESKHESKIADGNDFASRLHTFIHAEKVKFNPEEAKIQSILRNNHAARKFFEEMAIEQLPDIINSIEKYASIVKAECKTVEDFTKQLDPSLKSYITPGSTLPTAINDIESLKKVFLPFKEKPSEFSAFQAKMKSDSHDLDKDPLESLASLVKRIEAKPSDAAGELSRLMNGWPARQLLADPVANQWMNQGDIISHNVVEELKKQGISDFVTPDDAISMEKKIDDYLDNDVSSQNLIKAMVKQALIDLCDEDGRIKEKILRDLKLDGIVPNDYKILQSLVESYLANLALKYEAPTVEQGLILGYINRTVKSGIHGEPSRLSLTMLPDIFREQFPTAEYRAEIENLRKVSAPKARECEAKIDWQIQKNNQDRLSAFIAVFYEEPFKKSLENLRLLLLVTVSDSLLELYKNIFSALVLHQSERQNFDNLLSQLNKSVEHLSQAPTREKRQEVLDTEIKRVSVVACKFGLELLDATLSKAERRIVDKAEKRVVDNIDGEEIRQNEEKAEVSEETAQIRDEVDVIDSARRDVFNQGKKLFERLEVQHNFEDMPKLAEALFKASHVVKAPSVQNIQAYKDCLPTMPANDSWSGFRKACYQFFRAVLVVLAGVVATIATGGVGAAAVMALAHAKQGAARNWEKMGMFAPKTTPNPDSNVGPENNAEPPENKGSSPTKHN